MKKTVGILSVIAISLAIMFSSCNKTDGLFNFGKCDGEEISTKNLPDDLGIKNYDKKENFEKVIVQELVKSKECKGEIVSGIIEFHYEGEMVFSFDFGNGECDGLVTITWLEENGEILSKEIAFDELFEKDNECCHEDEDEEFEKECFEFIYPVDFTMPDGSQLRIENDDSWDKMEEWYENNPEFNDQKAEFVYPFQVLIFETEETLTINNEEEFEEIFELCDCEHDDEYREVIVEELVRAEECDGELVSGYIEYYKGEWLVATVDFGNGECDGIATKCTYEDDIENCEDFNLAEWDEWDK